MCRLILLLSLMTFSYVVSSAPVINKVVLDSSGLVITGKNFGADNPMLFWDDAKSSLDLSKAAEGDFVSESRSGKWENTGSKMSKIFQYHRTDDSRTRRKDIIYHGEGYRSYLGTPMHPKTDRLKRRMYVSWWYKPSMSPSAEGGSNKFIRIWDNPNGYGTRVSWTQMHFTCGEEDVTWGNWTGKVNEWNHHSIYVDLVAGKVQTRLNGKLIHDAKCSKHADYQNVPLYVQLVGFDHNLTRYQQMETNIDDIYIADSQARVEISDSPKWSATMIKEVMPIKTWGNNKIVAIPIDGKVHLSGEAYVYVVDDNGIANETGIKIDCIRCPKPVLSGG